MLLSKNFTSPFLWKIRKSLGLYQVFSKHPVSTVSAQSLSYLRHLLLLPLIHDFPMIFTALSMPQFSGGPVQFMTTDDIEYKRDNGWFLSYTKIGAIIVVFIIGVVAAGFLGWYINSLPKKKVSDLNRMDRKISTSRFILKHKQNS